MAEPFISEIRLFGFNFAPAGWATCAGQLLPINQNSALFSLLGTAYGGDGRTTMGLPDLGGRVPVGIGRNEVTGNTVLRGMRGGAENVTLTTAEMPSHNHTLFGTSATANSKFITDGKFAVAFDTKSAAHTDMYAGQGNETALAPTSVSSTGGNRSHTNLQPSMGLNFCIALTGLYPSRS